MYLIKIDTLFETVRRLEQSNQQLWQRFSGLSNDITDQKLNEIGTQPKFETPALATQHITDAWKQSALSQVNSQMSYLHSFDPGEKTQFPLKFPCARTACNSRLSAGPFATKISKLEHTHPTTYQFSPTFLEPVKADETVGTDHGPRGISKYTQMREGVNGIYPINTSPAPVEKESVALMPLVEGPGSISEDTVSPLPTCRQGLRSVSVGTTTRFDSPNNNYLQSGKIKDTYDYSKDGELTSVMPRPRMQNLVMRMMQESEARGAAGGNPQSQHQQQDSTLLMVHSDNDPFTNYPGMGKFPPKYVRRQLWTMDTVGTSSSASSSSSMGTPCIPYNNGGSKTAGGMRGARNSIPVPCNVSASTITGNPQKVAVKMEVGQARSMILMVLEELVNTESSYLHILSQFLILRDEIFAPNWRIDRQKFIRLFPAAVDDLCNLHRESFDAMKCAFDRTAEEMRHSEDTWGEDLQLPHQIHHRYSQYYIQRHRHPRGRLGMLSGGDDEASDDINSSLTTPFSVLLEMIEGKRPLACYSHSRSASTTATAAATLYYRRAPLWSTAPFFKLYARYLSEFSGAIQMLNKMRSGPTSLRKHLKQLQSHPACEFNDITTYLLAPVQRLPRYLLLVRKMIQYTEKIERFQNIPPTKRPRPRAGLRCSTTPLQPATTTPGFPSLDLLKKAEEALHGMLLELDEMIGGDAMDLKVEARDITSGGGEEEYDFGPGGGSGGSSGFIKANSVYSNNCSDSVDVNSNTTTFDNVSTEDEKDSKRRRAQSVVDPTRRKMRSSSTSFSGCSGGGSGGFWSRLKRLRLAFTSSQQKKTFLKASVNGAEAHNCGNTTAPKSAQESGAETLRRRFTRLPQSQGAAKRPKSLHRTTSSMERSNTSKVETWRRASSARPHNQTAPGKSTTPHNPQRSTQEQKHHSDKFDKRRGNRKGLPTRKAPRATEISKPMLFSFLHGEGRSNVPSVKSGKRGIKHTNKSDHRSSIGNTPIGAVTSTAKPSTTKTDSDSGVHTQTEEERRRRRPQPYHQAPLYREQPVFSTGRSRWIGRPGHTPFATTTTTSRQSRSKWQQQQQVPRHQSQMKPLRSSDSDAGGQAEQEASRSASPTLSSTSSITSSASSATAAESASALAPTVSTSYSLSNVDPHLQPSRPVVGVISEAIRKMRAPTPAPSPPSAMMETLVQEENQAKVEVQ
ncbi:Putative protein tag-52 [Echinococcus granulosus]|uniref:DH domain-containing protein n=1 Tax=Echinococcus granulosus TaxID=6210 RepID=W6UQX9_ECHGR|nr:Putative protein tag-52 [Echinococcus granulosus]EUB64115.1 Putative protein tag-52 [Echinococcus granulosus]